MKIFKTHIRVGGEWDDEETRYRVSVNLLDFLRRIANHIDWIIRFESLKDIVHIRLEQDVSGPIEDNIRKYILDITNYDWLDWVLAVPMSKIIYKHYVIPEEFVQMFLQWTGQQLIDQGFIDYSIRSDTNQGLFIRANTPGEIYLFYQKIVERLWYLFTQNAYLPTKKGFSSDWKLELTNDGYYVPRWGPYCVLLFNIQQNYGSVFTFLYLMEEGIENVLWYDKILKGAHTLNHLIRML